jgi:hypothetical protein
MSDFFELLPDETFTDTEPRFVRVREWERLTGMGPRTAQDLVGLGQLKAVRVGRALLIDYRHGIRWLESRPAAVLRPQKRPPSRRSATSPSP